MTSLLSVSGEVGATALDEHGKLTGSHHRSRTTHAGAPSILNYMVKYVDRLAGACQEAAIAGLDG